MELSETGDYSYDGGLDQIKMHLLESELHEIALGNFNVMIMKLVLLLCHPKPPFLTLM